MSIPSSFSEIEVSVPLKSKRWEISRIAWSTALRTSWCRPRRRCRTELVLRHSRRIRRAASRPGRGRAVLRSRSRSRTSEEVVDGWPVPIPLPRRLGRDRPRRGGRDLRDRSVRRPRRVLQWRRIRRDDVRGRRRNLLQRRARPRRSDRVRPRRHRPARRAAWERRPRRHLQRRRPLRIDPLDTGTSGCSHASASTTAGWSASGGSATTRRLGCSSRSSRREVDRISGSRAMGSPRSGSRARPARSATASRSSPTGGSSPSGRPTTRASILARETSRSRA